MTVRATRLVFAATLLSSVPASAATPEAVAAQVRELEAAKATAARAAAREARGAAIHERLARSVEELKARGAGLVDEYRLARRLRQSKASAERLAALTKARKTAGARVVAAAAALGRALDRRRADLLKAAPGDAAGRREWEAERKALDQLGDGLASGALAAPARRGALPGPGEELPDDPAELRELADEVQDHEDALRRRLDALSTERSRLDDRRRLYRLSADFEAEEALFDESVRGRRRVRLARAGRRRTSVRASEEKAAEGGDDDLAPNRGRAEEPKDEPPAAPPPSPAPGAPAGADGDGAFDDSDSDSDFAGEAGGGGAEAPTGGLSVATEAPADSSTVGPPILEGVEGADPALLAPAPGVAGPSDLASRIRALERERDRVRREADRLGRRHDRLRSLADGLEAGP